MDNLQLKHNLLNNADSSNELKFSVNGNKELTDMIKQAVSDTDWKALSKLQAQAIQARRQLSQPAMFSLCYSELNRMDANKNITAILPQKTPFRFVKRVIRRLAKVITAYQEIFNVSSYKVSQATLSIVRELSARVDALETENLYLKEKLESFISRTE